VGEAGGSICRRHPAASTRARVPFLLPLLSLSLFLSFYLVLSLLSSRFFIFFSSSILAVLASRARCRTKTSTQLTNNPKQFGRSDVICAFLSAKRGRWTEGISKTLRPYSYMKLRPVLLRAKYIIGHHNANKYLLKLKYTIYIFFHYRVRY